jgi:competence ComEA-like helix-hairpin-helix protein
MLRRFLKEFLAFSKWEQKGIIILLALIVIVALFQVLYRPKPTLHLTAPVQHKIDEFESKVIEMEWQKNRTADRSKYPNSRSGGNKLILFDFDPNTATVADFQQMGFTRKQADVIERYRLKGGVFRCKSDFQKIFVVSKDMFLRLEPFIRINLPAKDTSIRFSKAYKPVCLDINKADTAELVMLKGVGAVIAKRIVAYRDRLGGFVSNEQLLEVFGVDSSRYEGLRLQLKAPSPIVKIKVNSISYEELRKHPYLTAYQARNIIYYRTKKGMIINIQELVTNKIITPECSNKLKDYLDCSN